MERRYRRDMSHSYSKGSGKSAVHSHTVQSVHADDSSRHQSTSRPPGRAPASNKQPTPSCQDGVFSTSVGYSQRKDKVPQPVVGVQRPRSQPDPSRQNRMESAPCNPSDAAKEPALITRIRRWDSQRVEKAKDLRSSASPIQKPEGLVKAETMPLSEAHSKILIPAKSTPSSGTGSKIHFESPPKTKKARAGKGQKGVSNKKKCSCPNCICFFEAHQRTKGNKRGCRRSGCWHTNRKNEQHGSQPCRAKCPPDGETNSNPAIRQNSRKNGQRSRKRRAWRRGARTKDPVFF